MGVFTYKDIPILYEDNHLLIVEKPANILMQSDVTDDTDMLTLLKQYLKVTYNKPGDVFLGLVHRLDRPVGGVCVFAKTSKCASRLSEQIRTNQFYKTYHAIVCGQSCSSDTLVDYLFKNSKTNMVSIVSPKTKEGKKAILHYQTIQTKQGLSLVKIQLETGRSHQIRVQFSSRQLPLWGDQRYNATAKVGQQIALWATELSILHPITKERISFTSSLPKREPFTLFEV